MTIGTFHLMNLNQQPGQSTGVLAPRYNRRPYVCSQRTTIYNPCALPGGSMYNITTLHTQDSVLQTSGVPDRTDCQGVVRTQ